MSIGTQANGAVNPSVPLITAEHGSPADMGIHNLSNNSVESTESDSSADATPLLHIATLPLQKATLCYTPATPQPNLQTLLNSDQSTTCLSASSAVCYTPAIFSSPDSAASPASLDSSSTCDQNAAQSTSATCSTAHQSLLKLTSLQRRALDLLQAGHSVTAVARALNIHRVTVQRWKTNHPRFIVEIAHRAGLSQTETTLKAQRALDAAISLLLKRLSSNPNDAQAIAMRLIASPRLARLAASSSNPISLRQALSQFQQLRALDVPADAPADPALMDDLLAELDAPIAADPAKPAKAPKPTPEPKLGKPLPWAKPPEPTRKERYANHPIRPDLLAVFQHYGCIAEDVDTAARRPDLAPFDIHCLAFAIGVSPQRPKVLAGCYNDKHDPCGVNEPLNPSTIAEMIAAGLIKRLAGHDIAGYTASADPNTKALTLSHPTQPTITIPHDHLWRDAVLPA